MANAGTAVRVLREKESNDPQLLRTVEANANNTYSGEFEAMNATREDEYEWWTTEGATGPITFTIRLEHKARVVGIWLLHGEHRRFFTQVEVKAKDGHQERNMVTIPPKEAGSKSQYTWLQHPIDGEHFELIFNVDSATNERTGTSGSAGLKFVALAGWAVPTGHAEGHPSASEASSAPVAAQDVSEESERGKKKKKK
jgi:hypothetical protein